MIDNQYQKPVDDHDKPQAVAEEGPPADYGDPDDLIIEKTLPKVPIKED